MKQETKETFKLMIKGLLYLARSLKQLAGLLDKEIDKS